MKYLKLEYALNRLQSAGIATEGAFRGEAGSFRGIITQEQAGKLADLINSRREAFISRLGRESKAKPSRIKHGKINAKRSSDNSNCR